jgi:ABC-2 type transport system ATP-binding protein
VVGAVLESSAAYRGRTARDHLRVAALAGRATAGRVDEVLDLVDLGYAAGRRVGRFSLGMRQRLGLATALLCDPQILILDEPANGLDPEGVRWLRELLRRLAGEGRTVLMSSHILAEVAQIADSVVILDGGRLVAQATLAELTSGTETLEETFLRLTRDAAAREVTR